MPDHPSASSMTWHTHALSFREKTLVMGILNVTLDSFSDGGKFFGFDEAVAHAEKMAADGADIIDIGGESTRPYSDPVSTEEEIRRTIPVITELTKRVSVPISIDTTKAEVARQALSAGAAIINDISAFRLDPSMPDLAAEAGVPVILMHMQGTPKTMQKLPHYDDLIGEIKTFFEQVITAAVEKGIDRSKVIIDPGIGFGKTFSHNFQLLKHMGAFKSLGVPILAGPSRKAFIRNKLKPETHDDIHPEDPVVEVGTQAAIAAAVFNGAHIVRSHNVANTCATLKIIDAVKNA
jgi:dihydropteroate synthase